MLRHCPTRRQSLENLNKMRPCLGEISFDIALDATLFAQGPLSVDVSYITVCIFLNCSIINVFLKFYRNYPWQ